MAGWRSGQAPRKIGPFANFQTVSNAKLYAAVDAVGLPIRIRSTPEQYGHAPQARNPLAGLQGVGYVVADAAYNADDLGATAQIKATPAAPGTVNRNACRYGPDVFRTILLDGEIDCRSGD